MCMQFGYYIILTLIFVTFSQFELSHFWAQLVPKVSCERNSYNFNRILLKLCRCFFSRFEDVHDVRLCSPQIIFVSFFAVCHLNLVNFGSTFTEA